MNPHMLERIDRISQSLDRFPQSLQYRSIPNPSRWRSVWILGPRSDDRFGIDRDDLNRRIKNSLILLRRNYSNRRIRGNLPCTDENLPDSYSRIRPLLGVEDRYTPIGRRWLRFLLLYRKVRLR